MCMKKQSVENKNERAELTSFILSIEQWKCINKTIRTARKSVSIQLSDELDFRFTRLDKHSFSALLSHDGLQVFHFVWKEVDGVISLDHRIVSPEHRGKKMAYKVMKKGQ